MIDGFLHGQREGYKGQRAIQRGVGMTARRDNGKISDRAHAKLGKAFCKKPLFEARCCEGVLQQPGRHLATGVVLQTTDYRRRCTTVSNNGSLCGSEQHDAKETTRLCSVVPTPTNPFLSCSVVPRPTSPLSRLLLACSCNAWLGSATSAHAGLVCRP